MAHMPPPLASGRLTGLHVLFRFAPAQPSIRRGNAPPQQLKERFLRLVVRCAVDPLPKRLLKFVVIALFLLFFTSIINCGNYCNLLGKMQHKSSKYSI